MGADGAGIDFDSGLFYIYGLHLSLTTLLMYSLRRFWNVNICLLLVRLNASTERKQLANCDFALNLGLA